MASQGCWGMKPGSPFKSILRDQPPLSRAWVCVDAWVPGRYDTIALSQHHPPAPSAHL